MPDSVFISGQNYSQGAKQNEQIVIRGTKIKD